MSIKPIHNDPMLTRNTDRCRCMGCGAYFRGSGTFGLHRVGDWLLDGANRRCLTREEMSAKGWLVDEAGFWIRARMPASASTSRNSAVRAS